MSKIFDLPSSIWEKEYISGKWNYLENDPYEQSRNAIIGVFCKYYSPNHNILDIGCGSGALCDFLTQKQHKKYVGIDISNEAVSSGRLKRKLDFRVDDAKYFTSNRKFKAIIFNEILYYLDYQEILRKYLDLLEKDGVFIVSIYQDKAIISKLKRIWKFIENEFTIKNHSKFSSMDNMLSWDIKVLQKIV